MFFRMVGKYCPNIIGGFFSRYWLKKMLLIYLFDQLICQLIYLFISLFKALFTVILERDKESMDDTEEKEKT